MIHTGIGPNSPVSGLFLLTTLYGAGRSSAVYPGNCVIHRKGLQKYGGYVNLSVKHMPTGSAKAREVTYESL